MKYSIILHSPGVNFYIYWTGTHFYLCGKHGFMEEESFSMEKTTSEEAVAFIKEHIYSWASLSIHRYDVIEYESEILFHQLFHSLDQNGDKGTSLADSLDRLKQY